MIMQVPPLEKLCQTVGNSSHSPPLVRVAASVSIEPVTELESSRVQAAAAGAVTAGRETVKHPMLRAKRALLRPDDANCSPPRAAGKPQTHLMRQTPADTARESPSWRCRPAKRETDFQGGRGNEAAIVSPMQGSGSAAFRELKPASCSILCP